MNRVELADFLRTRREALQPEAVGLPRGPRRRTTGLRREEVAALAGMSTDYYSRLERQRGPQPSGQMLAAIARALHLNLDERDHLYRLAGHNPPPRGLRSDHVNPGLMRILDRLDDTPAQVVTDVGDTLIQTRLAVILLGNQTQYDGLERSLIYRWFTDSGTRSIHPEEDHEMHGRLYTAQLREAVAREGSRGRAGEIADRLHQISAEFSAYWRDHQIGLRYTDQKRILHPEVGELDLHCQMLLDPDQAQALLVFTATPGTPSYESLELLSVIGEQRMAPKPERHE